MYYMYKYFNFSGSKDGGAVHLWVVHAGRSTEDDPSLGRSLVTHVKSLEGHSAPITCLEFAESASLLASGCKAGSVRIWDLKVGGIDADRFLYLFC